MIYQTFPLVLIDICLNVFSLHDKYYRTKRQKFKYSGLLKWGLSLFRIPMRAIPYKPNWGQSPNISSCVVCTQI